MGMMKDIQVMRERLRAKDVELREAEIERQRIAHTCTQLQQSLNAFMQHEVLYTLDYDR